ncbi:MAG: type II toxin-antitoxin system VapC family toxin [Alphaproteobacteria bacterium]|nr:type II toxin-antitoxin system VapC family toxin [Alphaproteobacteria bacterium]
MVLDTSAIVATIAHEPDEFRFRNAMLAATTLAISAVTVPGTRIVLRARHGSAAVEAFDEMLEQAAISIAPSDARMASLAFDALRRNGKGQGHAARLDIGDCTADALARARGEPLLFKGTDFAGTDAQPAI